MAKVSILLPFILRAEGGFVNDPTDRGGATNKGVTIGTWKSVGYDKDVDGDIDVADLKLLTDKDVCDRVLKPHYWDRWKADQIVDQRVANLLVDWVWTSGSHGIVIPQRTLGLIADGVVGPKTLACINASNPETLLVMLYSARTDFMNGIVNRSVASYEAKLGRKATQKELLKNTQKRFQNGWLNRLTLLKKL